MKKLSPIGEHIYEELSGLKWQHCQFFSWLCAVRTLPLMGNVGYNEYWTDFRQTHLWAVLKAIDCAGYSCSLGFYIDAINQSMAIEDPAERITIATTKVARKVALLTSQFREADDGNEEIEEKVTHFKEETLKGKEPIEHAKVVLLAAEKANNTANRIKEKGRHAAKAVEVDSVLIADIAYLAAFASTADSPNTAASCADFAIKRFVDKESEITEILLNDIKIIRGESTQPHNNNITIYGEAWDSFLANLGKINCEYWAITYEDIFRKNFEMDEFFKSELCHRFNAPPEYQNEGASTVGHYAMDMADGGEWINEARIIIVGDKGAGKTSIARRLRNTDAIMPAVDDSTGGIDILEWNSGDKPGDKINVRIWDFAGDSITHSVHRCFMQTRCLYIYVYDGRIEQNNRPEYWLEQVKIYGGDAPVLFLVNRKDAHKPQIEINALKAEYPSIQSFDYFSIRDDINELEEFKSKVITILRTNPTWKSQEMPAAAFRVKEHLLNYFKVTGVDSITREEFCTIAQENEARSWQHDRILKELNILGICLHYDFGEGNLLNTLVLNPSWITQGIYKIIRWGSREGKHILTKEDCESVFDSSDEDRRRYPPDKIEFIYELMCKHGLAFFERQDDGSKIMTVPLLLTADRPDNLNIIWHDRDRSLEMLFSVKKALPPGIIPQIIVQRHKELRIDTVVWRKGVVLRYDELNTRALIIEKDREITVSVLGPKRSEYIVELRRTLDNIFLTYHELKVDLSYKMVVPDDQKGSCLITEGNIIAHYKDKRDIYNHVSGAFISTVDTVKAYNINVNEPSENTRFLRGANPTKSRGLFGSKADK